MDLVINALPSLHGEISGVTHVKLIQNQVKISQQGSGEH